MSQDSEPSVVEYARHYGLAQDHRACNPLQSIMSLGESLHLFSDEGPPPCDLESPSEPKTLDGVLPTERMYVDADTAKLLACITQPAQTAKYFDEEIDIPTMRCKKLRHELPLLPSDHGSDLNDHFQRFEPDLQNEFLPFESLNEDADEGLTWPSTYLNLPDEVWKKMTAEKLEIPADALRYLSEIMFRDAFDNDWPVFEIKEDPGFTHEKKILPKPVTPPLLPMSPVHVTFLPSSEVGHLELLSEHSSPTKEQLRKVEKQIFADDGIKISKTAPRSSPQSSDPMLLDSDFIGDIFSPLRGMKDPPSSPPDDRLPPPKLKVEVPLVVAEPESVLQRKQIGASFSEVLNEMMPILPAPLPEFDESEIMDEINTFLKDTIKPIAEKAERNIEQEQLQEADTTRRVKVPVMDFSLPRAPWDTSSMPSRSDGTTYSKDQLLKDMKTQHFRDHVWLLSGKIERDLQWTPFPAAMGKIELHETIRDDGTLATFLTPPVPVDLKWITWKPKIFDLFNKRVQYDEEELEVGSFVEGTDLQSMTKKRKLQLLEDEALSMEGQDAPNKARISFALEVFNSSSRFLSLENFMLLRSGTTGLAQMSIEQNLPQGPRKEAAAAETQVDIGNGDDSNEDTTGKRKEPILPSITISNKCRSFIMSAAFLKNRKLVRQFQKTLPSADFIERDWTLHLQAQLIYQRPQQVQSTTFSDSMADEADIIMSPGTGLILTTLQKIKQQALPGHAAQSTIREQIRRTTPRYETLVILISADDQTCEHDPTSYERELDHSDCEAIALFTAFCSNIDGEVQAIFVAGGHEELSKWIVTMMVRYSDSHPGAQLIQDETLWELFLRRAGLNAFAAQAILSNLSQKKVEKQEETDGVQIDNFGLTMFVKMSADERLARFEGIFGGTRLLSKINGVLEARW